MTKNQLQYWELQETKRNNQFNNVETNRHNVATETETNRHNVVTEGIDLGNLNESIRHNKITETETNRHNVATESEANRHNLAAESETNRHNISTENIDLGKLNETVRHNQVTETETNRSNLANERANLLQATARYEKVKVDKLLGLMQNDIEKQKLSQQQKELYVKALQVLLPYRYQTIDQAVNSAIKQDSNNISLLNSIMNGLLGAGRLATML